MNERALLRRTAPMDCSAPRHNVGDRLETADANGARPLDDDRRRELEGGGLKSRETKGAGRRIRQIVMISCALANGLAPSSRDGSFQAAKLLEQSHVVQKLALARVDYREEVEKDFRLRADGLAVGDAREAEQLLDEAARIIVARDFEALVVFTYGRELGDDVLVTEGRLDLAEAIQNGDTVLAVCNAQSETVAREHANARIGARS